MALGAAALSLVVYVLVAAVADVVVLQRLSARQDVRLATTMAALLSPLPDNRAALGNADPDDTPLFAWQVSPAGTITALRQSSPPLSPAQAKALPVSGQPVGGTVAGRSFALLARPHDGGELVVGTSVAELGTARTTLLAGEAALLPVVLLVVFLVAELIGRRAAMPLERARREQLDFTADASHELRTPISVIEAEVGLALAMERSAEDYRSALERVAGESARLRGVVDDLLWLARADALPDAPRPEPVALGPIVASCALRFEPVLLRAGGTLRLDVTDGDETTADGELAPVVRVPPEWIDRLVSMLVDNACRYAGENGVVEVAAGSSDREAWLRVDDSGPGIPPEQREAVRRRFHRASPIAGGAGLGLAVADTIVRATDGRLEIDRSHLGGARVEVSWPLAWP